MLVATVNKDWSEFSPSPFSTRYFSVPELNKLLHESGFNTEFYGAFSALPKDMKERVIAIIKRIAVTIHLIPKTMKGKEFLKVGGCQVLTIDINFREKGNKED